MTRSPYRHRQNFNDPGDAHELTFSCYRGYPFMRAERTCQWLATSINAARVSLDIDLWAFVFMPEHVHLIVHPRQPVYDIAVIRQGDQGARSRDAFCYLRRHAPEWIPRLTRRRGKHVEHLFWQSGGGYDRNIKTPKTLLAMIDYVHNNPVRRGSGETRGRLALVQCGVLCRHGESPIPLDPIPWDWVYVDEE